MRNFLMSYTRQNYRCGNAFCHIWTELLDMALPKASTEDFRLIANSLDMGNYL